MRQPATARAAPSTPPRQRPHAVFALSVMPPLPISRRFSHLSIKHACGRHSVCALQQRSAWRAVFLRCAYADIAGHSMPCECMLMRCLVISHSSRASRVWISTSPISHLFLLRRDAQAFQRGEQPLARGLPVRPRHARRKWWRHTCPRPSARHRLFPR